MAQYKNIDIVPDSTVNRIHLSQGDIGRTLIFYLFENALSWSVPASSTIKCQGTKPSGFGFSVSCTYSGNVVTCVTTEEMTDEFGQIEAELLITSSDESQVFGTSNFILDIEKNPHPDGTVDGDAENPVIANLNAVITQAVDDWLDEHPEATTTVADGSITEPKLASALATKINNKADTSALANEATTRANADTALSNQIAALQGAVGSPLVASNAASMTDTTKVYVYTGSETGYTSGDWYYYNGSAWVSGGVYNAVAINTDKTLSVADMAADAEATGASLSMLWQKSVTSDKNPFYVIDVAQTKSQYTFKNNDTKTLVSGFTDILKCPKYLSWNIPDGTSRLYLYIGDIVDGEFVLDDDYIFNTTSGGVYNYMNKAQCATVETDGTKYFYYSKISDGGIEIIGSDYFPEADITDLTFSPWWSASNGNPSKDNRYNSIFIPAGCFFVLNYGVEENIAIATPQKSTDFKYNFLDNKRFGYIDADAGYGVIRFPNAVDLTTIKIFLTSSFDKNVVVGKNRVIEEGLKNAIDDFKWQSKVAIPWSDSPNTLEVGKNFYGIPYSSRWEDAHNVGIEVSIETTLNALNDAYSIAYDLTSGRTAIGVRGGTGYGLVCSTCICMLSNLPYPQSIQGMTYDNNFKFVPSANLKKGDVVASDDHIAFVKNVFENGYSVFEEYQPCVGITTHTGKSDYRMGKYTTNLDYLDEYDYVIDIMRGKDSTKMFKNYDVELTNGSIRPWRGNKSVYSNADGFIGITVHDSATTAYLAKPGGSIVSISVSGQTVVDISSYCTEEGVYELYSDVSNTKEYFKYLEHTAVTLSIDVDGSVTFSDDDIEYAYITATDFGANATLWGSREEGPMTVHKNSKYPGLTDNVVSVINAMAYDEWGRYPVACSLAE